MASVIFYTDAPRGPADDRWQATNRALRRLIDRHRPGLERTIAIGHVILRRLESLFPILDRLCRVSCPWCPDPCCIVNKVWIDFQDLLLWHLTEYPIPPGQLQSDGLEPCRYLKRRGCALPRHIRPWGCTQYICTTQRKRLLKIGSIQAQALDQTIQAIRLARFDMEETFVNGVLCDRRQAGWVEH